MTSSEQGKVTKWIQGDHTPVITTAASRCDYATTMELYIEDVYLQQPTTACPHSLNSLESQFTTSEAFQIAMIVSLKDAFWLLISRSKRDYQRVSPFYSSHCAAPSQHGMKGSLQSLDRQSLKKRYCPGVDSDHPGFIPDPRATPGLALSFYGRNDARTRVPLPL